MWLKLSYRPFAFTSYKASLKKKRPVTSLLASFSAWFLNKNISVVISDQTSMSDCVYFVRYWAICVF